MFVVDERDHDGAAPAKASANRRVPESFGSKTRHLTVTGLWTMTGVVIYLLEPRTAPALLPLCVLAPVAWFWAVKGRLPLQKPSAVTIALLLAGIYLLINASWSPSLSSAYFHISWLFLFIAALHVTLGTLQETDPSVLRAMALGFLGAVLVGGAFLCLEAFSNQWVHQQAMSYVPWFRPSAHRLITEAGGATHLPPYLLNRSMSVLALVVWPALLALVCLPMRRLHRAVALLALAPAVAAIFRSVHLTSKLAFVGAALIYCVFRFSPTLARWMTITGWAVMTLFIVPLAALAYSNQLYLASWLPDSARHRIVIWGHTISLIPKAPLLGAGVDTARALHDPNNFDLPRAPGTDFRLSTSLHSHNAYLQTWLDTGAVGALFLLSIGLLILRTLASAQPDIQPYLFAVFVTSALLGAASFSLWQPWFLASFGLGAVFAAVGTALASARSPRLPSSKS